MNSQMASVTVKYRDGRVAQLENIYLRLEGALTVGPVVRAAVGS